MNTKFYFKLLFLLLPISIFSQTYSYQWAKTGGATNGSSGVGFNQQVDEHVLDMVTDSQNNTYYLVPMYNSTPLLDGQPVTNYGGKKYSAIFHRLPGKHSLEANNWKRNKFSNFAKNSSG